MSDDWDDEVCRHAQEFHQHVRQAVASLDHVDTMPLDLLRETSTSMMIEVRRLRAFIAMLDDISDRFGVARFGADPLERILLDDLARVEGCCQVMRLAHDRRLDERNASELDRIRKDFDS